MYDYEKQKASFEKFEGQKDLAKMALHIGRLDKQLSYSVEDLMNGSGVWDSWNALACIDHLNHMGILRLWADSEITQHKRYIITN